MEEKNVIFRHPGVGTDNSGLVSDEDESACEICQRPA